MADTEVTPRTRKNRMQRDRPIEASDCVGKEKFPLDCPRCGEPCTHLTTAYYESPWNEYGGTCGQCCIEAASHYDKKGWPPHPEVEPEKPEKPEADPETQGDLFD